MKDRAFKVFKHFEIPNGKRVNQPGQITGRPVFLMFFIFG